MADQKDSIKISKAISVLEPNCDMFGLHNTINKLCEILKSQGEPLNIIEQSIKYVDNNSNLGPMPKTGYDEECWDCGGCMDEFRTAVAILKDETTKEYNISPQFQRLTKVYIVEDFNIDGKLIEVGIGTNIAAMDNEIENEGLKFENNIIWMDSNWTKPTNHNMQVIESFEVPLITDESHDILVKSAQC